MKSAPCSAAICSAGTRATPGQLQHKPRLTRAELFNRDQTGLDLIREYEQKLPARQISHALKRAAHGGAGSSRPAISGNWITACAGESASAMAMIRPYSPCYWVGP